MRDLLITLAGLLLGPVFYRLARRREGLYGFLDGFVLVGVAGLVLVEVLPRTIKEVGYSAVACAAAGFALPFALERRFALLPFSPNAFFRWIMILGLVLHQLIDGVALSELFPGPGRWSLELAVILHQVPKGFFIWGMVGAAMGTRVALAVIVALCAATVAGFALGENLPLYLDQAPLWLFQAFIGGGLLHVIFHHVPGGAARTAAPEGGCCGEADPRAGSRQFRIAGGLGAISSLAMLWALGGSGPPAGAPGGDREGFTEVFARLCLESAPWILLGFIAAGVFHAFLPRVIFSWMGARGRMSQALRGIAIGLPLPLCSCGVVPVYLSLLKRSVPPAAALAFLIATPEIGIEGFFFSWNSLGLEITLLRIAMAFLIALAVAMTLGRTFEKIQAAGELDRLSLPEPRPLPGTAGGKLREALRTSLVELVDHTGAWLILGIAVAAVIEPYVEAEWISRVPRGVDVLVLSLIGMPLYVCAMAATPLAAVLIHKGVSIGAVLAFLITGPSTNVTTFGILRRYHGMKGAVLFAAAVYGFSIAIGFTINYLFPGGSVPAFGAGSPGHGEGPIAVISLGILCILFAGSILRLGPRGFLATLGETLGGPPAPAHPHHHHRERREDHQLHGQADSAPP